MKKPEKITVLIVEKESVIREMMLETLSSLGINQPLISTASSVLTAEKILQERRFDLLIVAGNLGDGDGVEIIKIARNSQPSMAIIFTGLITPEGLSDFGHIEKVPKPDLSKERFRRALRAFEIEVSVN